MNSNYQQTNLLRVLYNDGSKKTDELGRLCGLDNGSTAHQLLQLRDSGYVVADPIGNRRGGFATWSITAQGVDFMEHSIRKAMAASYGSVAPTLSAEQEIIKQLRSSLDSLRDDLTQVSEKLRAEKSINGELNGLVHELRTKLSEATAVKPVSGRHYFAVISQIQGSYTCKVVERFAREADALRTAETYAQTHNTETVSVCESKHIIQLEQVVNVKAVAKPI